MYEHVLVGTDGSETATRAVATAARLAHAHHARLTIVHAFKSGQTIGAQDCPKEFAWRLSAGNVADDIVKKAARSARSVVDDSLTIETHHSPGEPVTVLLDAIDKLNPDAVVVGNADVRGVRVRRSIGHALTRKASVDVIVVDTRAA